MKNSKGVTLVALVVTIIVLIILAGISMGLVLGDNGIIAMAKKAKENTEFAKTEEETELNELYKQLENEGGIINNIPVGSSAEVLYSKVYYGNIENKVYTFKKDYDNVIVITQSHNPHDADGCESKSYIKETTVEDKTIIDNLLFSGSRKKGEAISVAILRNVKAGDTIKTSAYFTSSLSIISL